MRQSFVSLVSQTANGVVDLIVENVPEDVMHAFELEECASGSPATAKESQTPDAPWGTRLWHQICPHSRQVHPGTHHLAVAGLFVAGALVIYMTALRMGYLGSEEAALLSTFNQTLPYLNISTSAPPPPDKSNSGLDANSSAQSPVLDYTNASTNVNITDGFSPVAEISIPTASPQSGVRARAPAPASLAEAIAARIYYQNMSETWHTMSDKRLLRKATAVPPLSHVPPVAKLACMFIARGPLPFAPLWERYFRGHAQLYSIYIHAHPDYVPTLAPTSPFFRRFIPSKVHI